MESEHGVLCFSSRVSDYRRLRGMSSASTVASSVLKAPAGEREAEVGVGRAMGRCRLARDGRGEE